MNTTHWQRSLQRAVCMRSIPIRSALPTAWRFSHRFLFPIASALVLMLTLTRPALAQLTPEQVAATKGATALVTIQEGQFVIGTAFCISDSGLFVTWSHVIYQAFSKPMKLVVNPGGQNERRYPVKIVREFKRGDLVLLQVELTQKVPSLTLGDSTTLRKDQQLFAFTYPLEHGSDMARNGFPSIRVDSAKITSLLKDASGLKIIQFDRQMTANNPGGPVLDEKGTVVGMFIDDRRGDGHAVPVDALRRNLSTPVIKVEKPKVVFDNRFDPVEFRVALEWLMPPQVEPTVAIEISEGGKVRQAGAVKDKDGKYHASIAPCLKKSGERQTKTAGEFEAGHDGRKVEYKAVVRSAEGPELAAEEGVLFLGLPGPAVTVNPPLKGGVALNAKREIKLPSKIHDVAAAEDGRVLLLHLKEIKKLAVFDVAELKIRGYIDLAEGDALFAGGSRHVLVALPAANLLQRFSLETLDQERAINNLLGTITGVSMGRSSPGHALILTKHEGGTAMTMFDVNQMAAGAKSGDSGHELVPRASADGRTFGFYDKYAKPSRFRIATFHNNSFSWFYGPRAAGMLVPNADGTLIFTSERGIYTPKSAPVMEFPGDSGQMLPSYHPAFFFKVVLGTRRGAEKKDEPQVVSIYLSGTSKPFAHLPDDFEEMNRPGSTHLSESGVFLRLDKRFHFYPQLNLFLTIPETDDRLVARPADVQKILDEKGIDYLYANSFHPPAKISKPYQYQLEAASKAGGVKVTLQSGPEGLTVGPDGNVTWTAPAKPTEETVIVTMKDASGREATHTFRIVVIE